MSAPLRGVGVVVTRPAGQGAALTDALERHGASVVTLPLTQVVPADPDEVDAELAALADADVVVVSSTNGARLLADALRRLGTAIPDGALVAAVGDATAAALASCGLRADIVPTGATGGALVTALTARTTPAGRHVVLARARHGRPELPDGLRAAGARVTDIALYTVRALTPAPSALHAARACPIWVFTAPSAIDAAIAAAGLPLLQAATLVSIGPTTSAHLHAHALAPTAEAAGRSTADLVAAVQTAARRMRATGAI